MEDQALLREYAETGSEPAFRRIVERHVNLVYSTARRRLGDAHRAEDVAQQVFILLARKASGIAGRVILSGWLYRTACLVAAETSRRDSRRERRDQVASETMKPDGNLEAWEQIQPWLDEAMARLGETDRDAVILRFFENRSLREVGAALGISDDAAQKRLTRAIDRLRGFLAAQHKPLTGGVLAAAIASGAVQSAPTGLASAISSGALAAITTATTTSVLTTVMSWTSLKSLVPTLAALAAGTAVVVQTSRLNHASHANAALNAALEAARQEAAAARQETAATIHAAENDARTLDLARLRAELAALRRQQSELSAQNARLRQALESAARAGEAGSAAEEEPLDEQKEELKTVGIAKLNYTKHWGLAFYLFAQEHAGRLPSTLEEAAAYFMKEAGVDLPSTVVDRNSLSFIVATQVSGVTNATVLNPGQFEILYQGMLDEVRDPAKTILLRERDPFPVPGRSGLSRTYLFADGHSEIYRAPEGDFTAWERERLAHPTQ